MSTMRVTRRRSAPLTTPPSPLFSMTRLPDPLQVMENALAAFPDMTSLFEIPSWGAFPAINMIESTTGYTVTTELPGLSADNVRVDFTDGVLTIEGEKVEERTEEEDGQRVRVMERRSGSFQRAFPFPSGVAEEKIAADFKDGILTIQLPKATEAQSKRRPITSYEEVILQ